MPQFNYRVMRKVTVWIEDRYTIEAENEEKADRYMANWYENESELLSSRTSSEFNLETAENMTTLESGGAPTVELYKGTRLLADNGIKPEDHE